MAALPFEEFRSQGRARSIMLDASPARAGTRVDTRLSSHIQPIRRQS